MTLARARVTEQVSRVKVFRSAMKKFVSPLTVGRYIGGAGACSREGKSRHGRGRSECSASKHRPGSQ